MLISPCFFSQDFAPFEVPWAEIVNRLSGSDLLVKATASKMLRLG